MPSAISREREPVGTLSTLLSAASSPRRIIEPLPKFFSIWLIAVCKA